MNLNYLFKVYYKNNHEDPQIKEYIVSSLKNLNSDNMIAICDSVQKIDHGGITNNIPVERIEVINPTMLRCVGIADSFEIPVFEYDIIAQIRGCNDEICETIGYVACRDCRYCIQNIDKKDTYFDMDILKKIKFKVIGNISLKYI